MNSTQPTLLSSAWKHRFLFALVFGVFVAGSLLFAALGAQSSLYAAEALIVLQDPNSIEGGVSERFISEQAEIMSSPLVSDVAAESLEDRPEELRASSAELLDATTISSSSDSTLVILSVVDESQERAEAMLNAMAEGYQEVSRSQATQTSDAALSRIDAQLATIQERFNEVSQEIETERSANQDLRQLQGQFQDALVQLVVLQNELVEADEEDAAVIRQQIADYKARIDTYRQAVDTAGGSPELQALSEEQDQLINRRAELLQRRDQIIIDAESAPGAVALLQVDEEATEIDQGSARRTLAVGTVLGLLAGFGVSYLLELRHNTFDARLEPESILGAPLLADIPHFAEENLASQVPARDFPRSAAAEGFRFAASSIEEAMRARGATSVMMVGGTLGHGKSTCVVNTTIAGTRQGHSVLLMDCDFGNQDTTRLLTDPRSLPSVGLIDVVEAGVPFEEAITKVPIGSELSFSLMCRGNRPAIAANLLSSKEAAGVFDKAKNDYDVVFVDAPPLLQVAYASTIANHVDALVVIVSHGSNVRELEELVNRLKLIDTPVIGYVYNRSPLRKAMTAVDGSMMDILGEGGSRVPDSEDMPWWQRLRT